MSLFSKLLSSKKSQVSNAIKSPKTIVQNVANKTPAGSAIDSLGVKLGNALTEPAQRAVINQPQSPQPQMQPPAQRTFAPQIQMPYNQPIQRSYSGMQFGNMPNQPPPQIQPPQRPMPPQMPQQPQMMPQNIQPQFARQFGAPPPQNNMGPQQYPRQVDPNLDRLVKDMGRPYI